MMIVLNIPKLSNRAEVMKRYKTDDGVGFDVPKYEVINRDEAGAYFINILDGEFKGICLDVHDLKFDNEGILYYWIVPVRDVELEHIKPVIENIMMSIVYDGVIVAPSPNKKYIFFNELKRRINAE